MNIPSPKEVWEATKAVLGNLRKKLNVFENDDIIIVGEVDEETSSRPPLSFSPSQYENLLQWADWLRSGDFQQGTGLLCKDEKYCCLGVYAKMAHPGSWKLDSKNEGYINDIQNEATTLPLEYQKEIGLEQQRFGIELVSYFIEMNDIEKYSFAQIAREIRSLADTGDFTREYLDTRQDK